LSGLILCDLGIIWDLTAWDVMKVNEWFQGTYGISSKQFVILTIFNPSVDYTATDIHISTAFCHWVPLWFIPTQSLQQHSAYATGWT
jgi:hypothetical protein